MCTKKRPKEELLWDGCDVSASTGSVPGTEVAPKNSCRSGTCEWSRLAFGFEVATRKSCISGSSDWYSICEVPARKSSRSGSILAVLCVTEAVKCRRVFRGAIGDDSTSKLGLESRFGLDSTVTRCCEGPLAEEITVES